MLVFGALNAFVKSVVAKPSAAQALIGERKEIAGTIRYDVHANHSYRATASRRRDPTISVDTDVLAIR
jgi:hypothetical protein